MRNKATIERSRTVEGVMDISTLTEEMRKLFDRMIAKALEANKILEGLEKRNEMVGQAGA